MNNRIIHEATLLHYGYITEQEIRSRYNNQIAEQIITYSKTIK